MQVEFAGRLLAGGLAGETGKRRVRGAGRRRGENTWKRGKTWLGDAGGGAAAGGNISDLFGNLFGGTSTRRTTTTRGPRRGQDIEGEATCHFITEKIPAGAVKVSRIGFGLPSGAGVLYADSVTLKSALEARREYK